MTRRSVIQIFLIRTQWAGCFAALLVVGLHDRECRAANLVVNPGFESGAALLGSRPTTFGVWRGDRVGYVAAENGILPPEGSRMLRFINTEFVPNGSTDTSQYWQNVDLSEYASQIASGNARLSASFLVNRVQFDSQTDTLFSMALHIRSGTPSSFTVLATPSAAILSDSILATWETLALSDIPLPATTTYVMLEIMAGENVFNDATNPEFDGHYADAVSLTLTVVPEPTGFALVMSALMSVVVIGCGRGMSPLAILSTSNRIGVSTAHRKNA